MCNWYVKNKGQIIESDCFNMYYLIYVYRQCTEEGDTRNEGALDMLTDQ